MTDFVKVSRADLADYMNDYHNQTPSGRCKADGQKWPCDVYVRLRMSLDVPIEEIFTEDDC